MEGPITKPKGSQQLYLLHQPSRREDHILAHADSAVTRHLAKKKSGNSSDQEMYFISREKVKRNKGAKSVDLGIGNAVFQGKEAYTVNTHILYRSVCLAGAESGIW